jgi:hypothetical protein
MRVLQNIVFVIRRSISKMNSKVSRAKSIAIAAVMAALANALSAAAVALPIYMLGFQTSIHFTQLAVFIAGILSGPFGGLAAGAIGGLFSGLVFPKIPFIIGGLAILGLATGFFAKKLRPLFAGILGWVVQAPYVAVTDYAWFNLSLNMAPQVAWALVTFLLVVLTIEVVACSALAEIIIAYLKRSQITL